MEKAESTIIAEIIKNTNFQSDKQIIEFEKKIDDVKAFLNRITLGEIRNDSTEIDISNKHLRYTAFNK